MQGGWVLHLYIYEVFMKKVLYKGQGVTVDNIFDLLE